MPLTGSTAAQRQPAPRDSGTSYSSRQQPAKNQPDLSGRLVYADPRSLPSFPSVGVKLDSTNAAALMASTTKSPPPILDTSGPVNPASLKAATAAAAASAALHTSAKSANAKPALSTDIPETQSRNTNEFSPTSAASPELPSPTITGPQNTASGNMAAKPSGASTAGWGNSAATQAFRNSQIASAKRASAPPEKPIPEIAALGHEPSLRAAKGAMKSASNPSSAAAAATASAAASASLSGAASASGAAAAGASSGNTPTMRSRNRAASNPVTMRHQKSLSSHYPDTTTSSTLASSPLDPKVSAANALSAATIAHTKSRSGSDRHSYVGNAGAVPYTNMGRQMYTSHPNIGPEANIQKHQDGLHASAIAMAKKMYNPKAEGGASAPSAPNVQEQAYKLAQERLEKIHEQHGKDREYRDHYMDPSLNNISSAGDTSRRLTMRGRLRRRRSSSDSDINADRMRSMEIRNQMSLLSSRISEVEDKRRRDRQNVLLAAQRNVKSQLQDIDEQVYANSGRLPPSLMTSLEPKITALAQARADAHIGTYPRSDQVDIGGGKFMDRAEVDKIATRRMQPLIDDMHEKAQQEIERKALLRQEEEERKAEAAMLKARDKEMKETYRQLKKDNKARKAEEKAAAKQTKKNSKIFGAGKEELTNGKDKQEEEADKDVMTAPDTSVSASAQAEASKPEISLNEALATNETNGEPSHAHGVASPDSPTVPAAVLATPLVVAGASTAVSSATAPVSASAPESKPVEAQPSATTAANRKEVRTETSGGSSSGRRLSKLFVKTPKEIPERKKSESNDSAVGKISGTAVAGAAGVVGAAGAVGAGDASQAKSAIPSTNGNHSSSAPATASGAPANDSVVDKASTPKSPSSPLSDNDSSSPNSNKVRSWFKSRFTRDRSKSSASTTAPSAPTPSKTASSGTVPTAAVSGPASSSGNKALGTAAVSDQRANAEKSFVGGHALTGAESPTPHGRSSGPAIGSGGLTMLQVTGGAMVAGAATAAGLSSSKDNNASSAGQVAADQPRQSSTSMSQQFYTPAGSQRQSAVDQPPSHANRDLEIMPGSWNGENIPEANEITGITTAKDLSEKDATALAQHGDTSKSFGLGLGPLTPVLMGPAQTAGTSGSTTGTEAAGTTSGSSGLPGSAAISAGAADVAGIASEAGASWASNRPTTTAVTLKEESATDSTVPGNRVSYNSSHYSNDAGVPGVAGSGFGLVGANIFANVSSTVPTEKGDNGNMFVSVPPPSTGSSGAADAGTFTPPKAIHDPAQKKSASPVRDSRFLENLEEYS